MELVDIVDENNELTGQVEDRWVAYNKGLWRRTVSCWIMNEKGEVLLQKRSPEKRRNPNKWAKTGGQVDAGETAESAILREVKEELGIDINLKHIELILSFKRKYDFVDVWLVREDIDISKLVLQEEEVSDVKWATIDEIRNLMKSSELAKSIDIYFDMFINLIDYPF